MLCGAKAQITFNKHFPMFKKLARLVIFKFEVHFNSNKENSLKIFKNKF